MSLEELEREFLKALPSDRVVYHLGVLATDRVAPGLDTPLSDLSYSCAMTPASRRREAAELVNTLANYVMQLESEGRAELACRPLGPDLYEYSLIKRRTIAPSEARCDWSKFHDGRARDENKKPAGPLYEYPSEPDVPRSKDWN